MSHSDEEDEVLASDSDPDAFTDEAVQALIDKFQSGQKIEVGLVFQSAESKPVDPVPSAVEAQKPTPSPATKHRDIFDFPDSQVASQVLKPAPMPVSPLKPQLGAALKAAKGAKRKALGATSLHDLQQHVAAQLEEVWLPFDFVFKLGN
jgi:hypothetical protein